MYFCTPLRKMKSSKTTVNPQQQVCLLIAQLVPILQASLMWSQWAHFYSPCTEQPANTVLLLKSPHPFSTCKVRLWASWRRSHFGLSLCRPLYNGHPGSSLKLSRQQDDNSNAYNYNTLEARYLLCYTAGFQFDSFKALPELQVKTRGLQPCYPT